jgi:hypothetical protein
MADLTDVQLTLTIPYPSYIPRARGIHAVGKFGTLFKAKCTLAEKGIVQQAADKLDITPTEFIRWCVVHCAKEVLRDGEQTDEPAV